MAAVAMVLVLVTIDLIVVAVVLSTARDHALSVVRIDTIEAIYAAEAGVNMAVREMMEDVDEDGDGTIGTISDDGDPNTDPTIGQARFSVSASVDDPVVGQTTLSSEGRSGVARRCLKTTVE